MKSIQRHLTFWLLITVLSLATASGIAVYLLARRGLVESFDRALLANARTVSGRVSQDEHGRLHIENDIVPIAEVGHDHDSGYFEIWSDDPGLTVLFRSPSLKGRDLPRQIGSDFKRARNLGVVDGRWLRAVQLDFEPEIDIDDQGSVDHAIAPRRATIVFGADRDPLDDTLGILATSLVSTTTVLAVGTVLAVAIVVRRGLRPLHVLGQDVDAIEVTTLSRRLPVAELPNELTPIAQRLNNLLDRLHLAFARERRFTSDVAHELRTPIAELKSMAEVALKWPEKSSSERRDRDTLAIALQMQSLVSALLSIARCEAGAQQAHLQPVVLSDLLEDAWRSYSVIAQQRSLLVQWKLTPTSEAADRALLVALVDNLFSNAVHYTPVGGSMEVRTGHGPDGFELSISNTCDTLTSADLPRLFEPFWRQDTARTDGLHCGLGLSIVAAYAGAMGLKVAAALPEAGLFCVTLTFA